MEIVFKNAEGLTDEQIKHFQNIIGIPFPADIKAYLKEKSNATPTINDKPCCFKMACSEGDAASAFIENIDSFESLKTHLSNLDCLGDFANHFELACEYVETEFLFPIANASGGALYVSIGGLHKGKIYFADNGDFGIVLQSMSLKDFWESVEECY